MPTQAILVAGVIFDCYTGDMLPNYEGKVEDIATHARILTWIDKETGTRSWRSFWGLISGNGGAIVGFAKSLMGNL